MSLLLQTADSPLLISVPHAGLFIDDAVLARMSPVGKRRVDTDWQVDRLARSLGQGRFSLLVAQASRYLIDLNRPPDDQPLYAGPGSGLVPLESFAGEPLYLPGAAPDAAEREQRLQHWWQPYHQQLEAHLNRLRERFGHAVLLDLHSIPSRVPRLFSGRLPDLNLGTYDGASCAQDLADVATAALAGSAAFSHVVNGRFKGGYITRHYGRPGQGMHALQLEIAQAAYLDEKQPERWQPALAARLIACLDGLVQALSAWRPG